MEPVASGTSPRFGGSTPGALISGKPYLVPYGAATTWALRHADRSSHRARCLPLVAVSAAALAQDDRFPHMLVDDHRFHSGRAERHMERRAGRVRSSADDAGCDPGGGRGLQELHRADVAGGGAARHFARELRPVHRRASKPDVKIMDFVDAQPEFTKAFWDYVDLLVTEERITQGPRVAHPARSIVRGGGARLRRRPLCHRGDLGHRDEIRRGRGRAAGDPLDRDARLRRAAAGVLQGRVSRRAGNPASRRHPARAAERLMGRRVRADAVHADGVQALCGRLRRRRAARCGRLGAGRDRLDGEPSGTRPGGSRARPGATRSCCRRASITCSPIRRAG